MTVTVYGTDLNSQKLLTIFFLSFFLSIIFDRQDTSNTQDSV